MANLYGPRIVTDGLMLYFDPANRKCYPGSGTTMYDLSGRENNGTMQNGVSVVNNVISFDGTNDRILVTNNGTNFDGFQTGQTLMIWEYHTFTSGRRVIWNQGYGGYGTWTHEQGGNISSYWGDAGGDGSPYNGRVSSTTTRSEWNCMATTRDTSYHKWYKDGVNTHNYTHSFGTLTDSSANLNMGYGYTGVHWVGQIGLVMAYERALTADEMKQNYDALKGRFGK